MRHRYERRFLIKNIIMANIYEDVCEKVMHGTSFTINFKERSLKVGKRYVIKDGETNQELGIRAPDDVEQKLANLFHNFEHSIPSERSEQRRHGYFRPLKEDDISDEDFLYGMPRELARFELEYAFLCYLIMGILTWNPEWGTWFRQNPHNKRMIILKEWF